MNRFRLAGVLVGMPLIVGLTKPAAALQIEGLGPLRTVEKEAAELHVREETLEIALKDGPLQIHAWPGFLPREFKPQRVSAARFLHPAGPSDRVELAERRDHAPHEPWLILLSGARPAQAVIGPWSLRHGIHGWALAAGNTLLRLHLDGAGTPLRADGARWCIYALREVLPPQSSDSGLATETQARLDLVAWRQSVLNPQCKRGEAAP